MKRTEDEKNKAYKQTEQKIEKMIGSPDEFTS